MSGGHFDYDQYRIGRIADDVQKLIDNNNSTEENQWGDPIGNDFPEEVIERFKQAVKTLALAQAMAQRIDWLISGDDGVDTFINRWQEDMEKLQ